MRTLLFIVATLAIAAIVPARAQQADAPVTAVLRVAGDRASFKSGEPITLELVLIARAPGFVVDIAGLDGAEEKITVAPESGVTRLQGVGGRDVVMPKPITAQESVLPLTLNYWMRFDRAGDYAFQVTTRRVSGAGKYGWSGGGERLVLTTNAVMVHVDMPTVEEDRVLFGNAVLAFQAMNPRNLGEQIRLAEHLAFLGSDDAAIEKYRQYRTIASRAPNAREILRRGFFMSRNPGVILDGVLRELDDPTRAVSATQIADAIELRLAVEGRPRPARGGAPPPAVVVGGEVDVYYERVHASLDGRRGAARRDTALTLFTTTRNHWPDVRDIVSAEFDEFSLDTRKWLLTTFAEELHVPNRTAALLRAIAESEPNDRRGLLGQLAKVDPRSAVPPFLEAIVDPKVSMLYDVADDMPPGSLSAATRGLMNVITTLLASKPVTDFRFEQRVALLPIVADGSVVAEVSALYDRVEKEARADVRGSLLGYLLKWDPSNGLARLAAAVPADDGRSVLGRAIRYLKLTDAQAAVLRQACPTDECRAMLKR